MPEDNENGSQVSAQQAQEPVQAQEPAPGLKQVNFQERVTELENFLRERDKEISELKKSLEIAQTNAGAAGAAEEGRRKAVQEAQAAVQEGAKALQEKEAALADRDKALATVLTAYRTAILQSHPDIPEELVTGSTLEELQGSLGKAKELVQKIRSQAAVVPAPAGAPARSAPDFSAMSPREKIVQGLTRK